MINGILKISELAKLLVALKDAKLLVANKQNKKNYYIQLSDVKGDKIVELNEYLANESSSDTKNTIELKFDDESTKMLNVFNGKDGEIGKTGPKGIDGKQGNSMDSPENYDRIKYYDDVLFIVNNNDSNDINKVWSAYQGKVMQDFLNSLSEIIMDDDTYDLLFRNEVSIDLEYDAKADNQDILIVHSDNSSHKTYIKYWTYEDEADEEYFYLIKNSNNKDEYVKIENVDGVPFDIWTHYYLTDNPLHDVYYTRKIHNVINEETGEIISSDYIYTEISKPTWMDLEFTTTVEDVNSIILYQNPNIPQDDDHYIPSTPEDEEIITTYKPITEIYVDNLKYVDLTVDINKIITKTVTVKPTDYSNSLIGIEYDATKIQVFEDGRIMALDEPCETVVKIFSVDNPNIFAQININVVVLVNGITFENPLLKCYKDDPVYKIVPIIMPENVTNPVLKYEIESIYEEIDFDDVFDFDSDLVNISFKPGKEGYIYYKDDNDEYDQVFINNLAQSYQLINSDDEVIFTYEDDIIPVLYLFKESDIASVDEEGNVTFLKEGTTTVYVSSTDGSNLTSTLTIEVQTRSTNIEIDCELYNMTKTHTELNENGEEIEVEETIENCLDILLGRQNAITINATVLPENTSNKTLIWELVGNGNVQIEPSEDTLSCIVLMNSYSDEDDISLRIRTEDNGAERSIRLIGKQSINRIEIHEKNKDTVNSISLDKDETITLTAIIDPNNASNKKVIWSLNEDPSIVELNNGKVELIPSADTSECIVTAIGGGDSKIYVRPQDGSKSGGKLLESTVNVASVILITSITLNNNKDIVMYSGLNTYSIGYDILPIDAYNKRLIWKSTNENVVTVNENGEITSHNAGNAKVYAIANDNSGVISNISVKVITPSEEINFTNDDDEYVLVASTDKSILLSTYVLDLDINENYTLVASIYPDNASIQLLNYEVEDDTIADVDNNGNITALKSGTTKVFVSSIDKDSEGNPLLSAECIINVK